MRILGYSIKFNHMVVLIKTILKKKMLSFSKDNEFNHVIEKVNAQFFV